MLKRLRALSRTIILSYGWRRAATAVAAGALSALAMAPFNIWPVLFLTFPVCVWLLDGAAGGRHGGLLTAAGTGWCFGFGYFLAGVYWVGNALLVDANVFGWLLPVAVLGLPAGLAFFTALGFGLARLLWSTGSLRILALAAGLTISEWLRGHVLTGFPWNAFGYAFSEPLALAQTASLVGLWGLTLLAVGIFASPVVLLDDRSQTRHRWIAPLIAALLLMAMSDFGTVRMVDARVHTVDGVKLRLMQPNLTQDMKFNYSAKAAVMQKYLSLSDRATGPQTSGVRDATILVWPESAFPFFLTREPDAMAQIAALLPKGTILITGGVRPPESPPGVPITRAYNSIYVIDHDGTVLSIYDKLHLVPFGEYLPFQSALEKLGFVQLTKVQGGFIAGVRRKTIDLPNAPRVLPLICYEIIFPHDIVPPGERPAWIVNVTNDGWFGNSTGPHQHLQQAQMRAIEEGLPIVRAANTGISAVIDPLGRIVAELPLGTEGVLDARLPTALAPPLYARLGDGPALMMVGLAALLAGIGRRKRSPQSPF